MKLDFLSRSTDRQPLPCSQTFVYRGFSSTQILLGTSLPPHFGQKYMRLFPSGLLGRAVNKAMVRLELYEAAIRLRLAQEA